MKPFYQIVLGLSFISFGLFACTGDTSVAEDEHTETAELATKNETTTADVVSEPERIAHNYVIKEESVDGITPGQRIEKLGRRLNNGEVKNSEGVFSVLSFFDEDGKRVGYFFPDPQNEKLVGDIVIVSTRAATPEGIKVGSTFAELQAVYPDVEVHGSEIEGLTTAVVGNRGFVLRAIFNTYEVDEAQIEPDTRITQIKIMRQRQAQKQ